MASVADEGNTGGVGGFTKGGKYLWQLGGVGECCKLTHRSLGWSPRSFASYHYCFLESYGISILFIKNKIVHVYAQALVMSYICTYINLKQIIYQVTPFFWPIDVSV